jgi:hypothetical protein
MHIEILHDALYRVFCLTCLFVGPLPFVISCMWETYFAIVSHWF